MATSALATAYVNLVPGTRDLDTYLKTTLSGKVGAAGQAGGTALANGVGQGFGSKIKGILAPVAATMGATLATVGVANFFRESVREASNFQAEFEGVNQTFGKSAKIIQDYAKQAALTAGLSEVEALRSAKSFGVFAKSAGLGGDAAATFSKDMVQLAGDLGSFNDVPTADALAAIQSALMGQSEPMRRFGVLLDDATIKHRAMEMGIYSGTGALTAQQKVLAVQAEILAQTTLQQGDFIKYQNDFSNALKTVSTEFDNVKKSIGIAFLPALTSVVVGIRDNVMPQLQRMAEALPALFAKLSEPGGFVKLIQEGISKLVAWINGGGISVVIQNFVAMRVKIIEALASTLPEIITSLAQALVAALPVILDTLIQMIPVLLETATLVFNALITAFVTVFPMLITAIVDAIPRLIQVFTDNLPTIIDGAVTFFMAVIDGLILALPLIITALVNAIPKIIDALVNALPKIIDGAFKLFTGIIEGLVKATPDIIDAIIDLMPVIKKAIIDSLPKLIEAGIEILKGIGKGIVENAPRIIGSIIASLGELIINTFKNVLGIASPSKVFYGFGKNIGQGLINGLDAMAMPIQDSISAMSNQVISPNVGFIGSTGPVVTSLPGSLDNVGSNVAGNTLVYNAAPNNSLDAEQALFQAMRRSKVVAGW